MTPRSQSVSKSTATYQGYLATSLEYQGMMQNVWEMIRSIWKLMEQDRRRSKERKGRQKEMNRPKVVLGHNTILLLRSKIRISFCCHGRMTCRSAYHRNELGGPSYHSRSRESVCNQWQYDCGTCKYGIFGHFYSWWFCGHTICGPCNSNLV